MEPSTKPPMYFESGTITDPEGQTIGDHWKVAYVTAGNERLIYGFFAPDEESGIPLNLAVMTYGEAKRVFDFVGR